MNGAPTTKTKVLRLRLKDKHAKFLSELAREVNFVWNYCNELQITMFNRERRFLSGYDFAKFTRGATKEGLHLHSQTVQAMALFFLGTAVAGVGFGTGFQGAVRSVIQSAAPHERAGTLSIVFIISYLAMGVPAVAAGLLLAQHVNIIAVAQIFCAVLMALAGASLAGGAVRYFRTRGTYQNA